MADSDFNVIKPVESLQTIQGLTPTTRQQERRRRQRSPGQHRDGAQDKQEEPTESVVRDDTDDHRLKRSESLDNGNTWSPILAPDLPNPRSGIEAIVLKSGRLAMAYNDKEMEPRDRLAVSISEDMGETWKWTRHLEDVYGQRFDYPSIIQSKDGSLHVSYSYNLSTIKHVHLDEKWVIEEEIV